MANEPNTPINRDLNSLINKGNTDASQEADEKMKLTPSESFMVNIEFIDSLEKFSSPDMEAMFHSLPQNIQTRLNTEEEIGSEIDHKIGAPFLGLELEQQKRIVEQKMTSEEELQMLRPSARVASLAKAEYLDQSLHKEGKNFEEVLKSHPDEPDEIERIIKPVIGKFYHEVHGIMKRQGIKGYYPNELSRIPTAKLLIIMKAVGALSAILGRLQKAKKFKSDQKKALVLLGSLLLSQEAYNRAQKLSELRPSPSYAINPALVSGLKKQRGRKQQRRIQVTEEIPQRRTIPGEEILTDKIRMEEDRLKEQNREKTDEEKIQEEIQRQTEEYQKQVQKQQQLAAQAAQQKAPPQRSVIKKLTTLQKLRPKTLVGLSTGGGIAGFFGSAGAFKVLSENDYLTDTTLAQLIFKIGDFSSSTLSHIFNNLASIVS